MTTINKYKIRVIKYDNWIKSFTDGILIADATLWKDEYIYETDLTFEEVKMIPCITSIKNLLI